MQVGRKPKLPIPVTILTGALGTGKTTALRYLARAKPPDEVWAVLVNEFGAVGIDAIAIEGSVQQDDAGSKGSTGAVTVRQIAGGCMCCTLSGPLSASIAQIVRQVRPDRLVIEPSGLGHPGGLLDVLQGQHLGSALQLRAVLCLVDLTTFDPDALMTHSVFADQVNVADCLLGSKADAAPPGAQERFLAWAQQLFPPKLLLSCISNGQLDVSLLDVPRDAAQRSLLVAARSARPPARRAPPHVAPSPGLAAAPTAASGLGSFPVGRLGPVQHQRQGQQQQGQQQEGGAEEQLLPQPGRPLQVAGSGGGDGGRTAEVHSSCGWVFDQRDVFDRAALLRLLRLLQPHVARVKCACRVGPKLWVVPATVCAAQSAGVGDAGKLGSSHGAAGGAVDAIQAACAGGQGGGREGGTHAAGAPGGEAGGSASEGCRGSGASSDGRTTGAAAAAPQLVLEPICYRGDSRFEVIVALGAPGSAPGAGAPGYVSPQQGGGDGAAAAAVAADAGTAGLEAAAAAAVARARVGCWEAVEQLLVACLHSAPT